MADYNPQRIERKWQRFWEREKVYRAKDYSKKPKLYLLVEFPYPSGAGLHVGHCRSYTAMDVIARKGRMKGFNVLFPMGWDAFGLPTENYAIKTGIHPRVATRRNSANFKRQEKSLGLSFDWNREVNTTDPNYYKWTQWIFVQLFKYGLAYKAKIPINWCPVCKIGLANEEVIDGCCERCGEKAVRKEKAQWLLKITKYAERLIQDLHSVDFPKRVKILQREWIGKSCGVEIKFPLATFARNRRETKNVKLRETFINVFTTRIDTIFGCTYLVTAPEHQILERLKPQIRNLKSVEDYIEQAKGKLERERLSEAKEKAGIRIEGVKAVNPATNKKIPIFVADYVLMHYGTGAIMGVPANDQRDLDFARAYNLPVVKVVEPDRKEKEFLKKASLVVWDGMLEKAYEGEGVLINSGRFNGLRSEVARERITQWLERMGLAERAVHYKLRDWIFSRQRYWGEPIPLVFCNECKKQVENYKLPACADLPTSASPSADRFACEDAQVEASAGRQITNYKQSNLTGSPELRSVQQNSNDQNSKHKFNVGELLNPGWVAVLEKDLPVKLPRVKDYKPTEKGESPLATVKSWVNTKCPRCGCFATRETDVMPNWAGSNWYYLRYCDPDNVQKLANPRLLKYWMPVDWYNGGMEHTTLHLLYSRFIYKFLWDIEVAPRDTGSEPYKRRTSHGMILGEGGIKMSKSKGNIINPEEVIKQYGADTLRVYEMFMGPFDQAIAWDRKGVIGARRFLEKTWKLAEQFFASQQAKTSPNLKKLLHKTMKKVSGDIENLKFNTAVSSFMEFGNAWQADKGGLGKKDLKDFLKILSPFAPHLAEELWHQLGYKRSIFLQKWPKYNQKLIEEEKIYLIIQVNGRVRDKVEAARGITEAEAQNLALQRTKIKKWIEEKKVQKTIFVKDRLINFVV